MHTGILQLPATHSDADAMAEGEAGVIARSDSFESLRLKNLETKCDVHRAKIAEC
jgi:hypothetical protein